MEREQLSEEYVRKIARLSRLSIRDHDVATYQRQLSAVLSYVQRLQEFDLSNVEPLTNVAGTTNRLAKDEPHAGLKADIVRELAPESWGKFIRVPKVLDDGGSS